MMHSMDATLEELDREECLKLVGSLSIGRLAVTVEEYDAPLVVPVNYVLDGEVVVFRSGPGSKLRALRDTPVSFQVDLIDPFHRTGWSVLIRGVAREATDREVEHLVVETWAPGDKHHWIRVLPTVVTGRTIQLPDVPWESRGYR
ncbi:MAG: uncharacterized protein QOH64_1034 [Acidimicrobiaceae bacterium]